MEPKGKNEAILALCINACPNIINTDVSKLLKGEYTVSDIFNQTPINQQRDYWNRLKIAREKELYTLSDTEPENDILQADISLELFDLNLLETYLNQCIFSSS